jgi:hypothetical protein
MIYNIAFRANWDGIQKQKQDVSPIKKKTRIEFLVNIRLHRKESIETAVMWEQYEVYKHVRRLEDAFVYLHWRHTLLLVKLNTEK